MRIVIKGS